MSFQELEEHVRQQKINTLNFKQYYRDRDFFWRQFIIHAWPRLSNADYRKVLRDLERVCRLNTQSEEVQPPKLEKHVTVRIKSPLSSEEIKNPADWNYQSEKKSYVLYQANGNKVVLHTAPDESAGRKLKAATHIETGDSTIIDDDWFMSLWFSQRYAAFIENVEHGQVGLMTALGAGVFDGKKRQLERAIRGMVRANQLSGKSEDSVTLKIVEYDQEKCNEIRKLIQSENEQWKSNEEDIPNLIQKYNSSDDDKKEAIKKEIKQAFFYSKSKLKDDTTQSLQPIFTSPDEIAFLKYINESLPGQPTESAAGIESAARIDNTVANIAVVQNDINAQIKADNESGRYVVIQDAANARQVGGALHALTAHQSAQEENLTYENELSSVDPKYHEVWQAVYKAIKNDKHYESPFNTDGSACKTAQIAAASNTSLSPLQKAWCALQVSICSFFGRHWFFAKAPGPGEPSDVLVGKKKLLSFVAIQMMPQIMHEFSAPITDDNNDILESIKKDNRISNHLKDNGLLMRNVSVAIGASTLIGGALTGIASAVVGGLVQSGLANPTVTLPFLSLTMKSMHFAAASGGVAVGAIVAVCAVVLTITAIVYAANKCAERQSNTRLSELLPLEPKTNDEAPTAETKLDCE